MNRSELPLDQIIQGDCVEVLNALPEKSIDLVFADPPYHLQLQHDLWRPNNTRVAAVDDAWDQFESFAEYDQFSRKWLAACRRVLKDSGTIWVIGSYHNIYRLGAIMQDLGFWFLNDVVWIKTNPMPNFRGVRFTNSHETLIWASKFKGAKYTFNHHAMKALNDDRQMRSDWLLPICSGKERLKVNGVKAHSTQKPQALLYRVILSSTHPGDVVLDPFFGSGTTGAVAKLLQRHWIGIEQEPGYIELARQRINAIIPGTATEAFQDDRDLKRLKPRLPFSRLLESGLLHPGQVLYFQGERGKQALIQANGKVAIDGFEGSIHQAGRHLLGGRPCNGWEQWYYTNESGSLEPIDALRQILRENNEKLSTDEQPIYGTDDHR